MNHSTIQCYSFANFLFPLQSNHDSCLLLLCPSQEVMRMDSVTKWICQHQHVLLLILVVLLSISPTEAISLVNHHYSSPDSSRATNEYHQLNVTHDLLMETKSSEFNTTNWLCFDHYQLENYNSLIEPTFRFSLSSFPCKCHLNWQCNAKPTTETSSSTSGKPIFSLWLRCYDHENSDILFKFTELLSSKKWITLIDTGTCLHTSKEQDVTPTLRADFIRCNETSNLINMIKDITTKRFADLTSLTISESGLEQLPDHLFDASIHLQTLNLTRNNLKIFDSKNLFSIESSKALTTIDLRHCGITRVDLSLFSSLRSIKLSHNSLSTLAARDFPSELIQSLNNLLTLKKSARIDLNLANNPWTCDDELSWLINYITAIVNKHGRMTDNTNGQQSNSQLQLFQSDEPECDTPTSAKMFPFSVWKSVKEVSICKLCDCNLKDKYAKVGYRYVIVNCTDRNLNYLPIDLPKNAKIFDLTNNQIRNLNTLSLSRAKLSLWRNVNKIILRNNSLETLDGLDQIRWIVYLDISGNLLTEIPYHILNQVLENKVDNILLGDNPFTCDCNTLKMQKWLQTNYPIISDIDRVRCGYMRTELTKNESNIAAQVYNDRFYNREILKINSVHLCPSIASLEFFDVLNFMLAFLIIFLIFKVLYDYFWQRRTGKLPQFFKLNM